MNTNDKKDPEKDLAKETQKVMNSYMDVLKHQLGRTPTIDELINFVGQQAEPGDPSLQGTEPLQKPLEKDAGVQDQNIAAQLTNTPEQENVEQNEPSFIHLQVFYGMKKDKDGSSKPDSTKILFYANAEGMVFDVAQQEWLNQKPSILEHLPSRPIQYNEHDIMSAIVNGVLEENDFNLLLQADMVSDNAKRVWEKTQELHSLMDEYDNMPEDNDTENFDMEPLESSVEFTDDLQKSEWENLDEIESEDESDGFYNEQPTIQRNDSHVESVSEAQSQELLGTNLIDTIMNVAMSNPFFSPAQEARIREIIAEGSRPPQQIPQ